MNEIEKMKLQATAGADQLQMAWKEWYRAQMEECPMEFAMTIAVLANNPELIRKAPADLVTVVVKSAVMKFAELGLDAITERTDEVQE